MFENISELYEKACYPQIPTSTDISLRFAWIILRIAIRKKIKQFSAIRNRTENGGSRITIRMDENEKLVPPSYYLFKGLIKSLKRVGQASDRKTKSPFRWLYSKVKNETRFDWFTDCDASPEVEVEFEMLMAEILLEDETRKKKEDARLKVARRRMLWKRCAGFALLALFVAINILIITLHR